MTAQPFFLDIPKHANTARETAKAAFTDAPPTRRAGAGLSEPGRFERLVSERLAQPQREKRESGASDEAEDAQKSSAAGELDQRRTATDADRGESQEAPVDVSRGQTEQTEQSEQSVASERESEPDRPVSEQEYHERRGEPSTDQEKESDERPVAEDQPDQKEASSQGSIDAPREASPAHPKTEHVEHTDPSDAEATKRGRPSGEATAVDRPAPAFQDASQDASARSGDEARAAENAAPGNDARPERTQREPVQIRPGEVRSEGRQAESSSDRSAGNADRVEPQKAELRPATDTRASTDGSTPSREQAGARSGARADSAAAVQSGAVAERPSESTPPREAPRFESSEYKVAEAMRDSGGERRSDAESNPDRDDRSRADARAAAAAAAASAADRATGARSSAFVELMDASRAQVRSAAASTLSANGAATPSASAAPSLGATATPAGAELSDADQKAFQASVSRGLGAAVRQRGGVMTLRLNPASLGNMRIEMSIRQGAVSARIEASTQQAQQLLMRNMTQLRSALEGRGLSVERLQVTFTPAPSGGPASESGQQDAQPGSQDRSSRQDAGDGQSRGAFDRREERGAGGSGEHEDGGIGPEGLTDEQREPGFHGRLRLRLNAIA